MNRIPSIPILERFARRLSPYWVFFGIVVGFGAMVFAGRWAGRQNLFIAYKRSYPLIAPEGYFYPSLNNLTQLVTRAAPRRKILVLVGGDSVLLGVGQKKEQLWTGELQRLLGPRFAVINLAFRGALPSETAAVVAEVLSKKYPRLIYVSRSFPMSFESAVYGTYNYLFWQAKASGGLLNFDPRSEAIRRAFSENDPKRKEQMGEAVLRGYFDVCAHASDLWNYVGYNSVFTLFNANKYPPERFFEPRKNSEDQTPDTPPIPERFTYRKQSMEIIRSFAKAPEQGPSGEFKIKQAVSDAFLQQARAAIPDVLKSRTLILLSYDAPFFTHQLSTEEYAGYQFDYSQGAVWLQKAGYHSLLLGQNWSDEDYADRTHLTAIGGRTLANAVAPEIRSMAVQLGYISVVPSEQNP